MRYWLVTRLLDETISSSIRSKVNGYNQVTSNRAPQWGQVSSVLIAGSSTIFRNFLLQAGQLITILTPKLTEGF